MRNHGELTGRRAEDNLKGKIRIPRLVKPVAAIMTREREYLAQAAGRLSEILGETDLESPVFPFDQSEYYRAEMGPSLLKQFFSFGPLRRPEDLVRLKRRTAACERLHRAPQGGRLVNIDPGYWSDAKLVLASTKNYSHRICLGRRIFGEVTLRYHQGSLQPLEWTYPDYRSRLALDFFEKVRRTYLQQIAQIRSF